MSIQYIDSVTGTTTVTMPATAQVGDVAVLVALSNETGGYTMNWDARFLNFQCESDAQPAFAGNFGVGAKVLAAGDLGSTVTITIQVSGTADLILAVYRGAAGFDRPATAIPFYSWPATSITNGPMNTGHAGLEVVGVGHVDGGGLSATAPASIRVSHAGGNGSMALVEQNYTTRFTDQYTTISGSSGYWYSDSGLLFPPTGWAIGMVAGA